MNRVPVSPITPRLLACAQILSGRSLLTESDIARFGRQHFDHCAFLTEHVCANDQVAVHVQPQTLSPVMATFIQSALLTTSTALTSAIVRAHTTTTRLTDAHDSTFTPQSPQRTPRTLSTSHLHSSPAPWRLRTSRPSSLLSHARPLSPSYVLGLFPLRPPLGGEGEGSVVNHV